MTFLKAPVSRLMNILEFIKFSHTIFALPFALISMMLAVQGWPHWSVFGWILLCMVSARTAAMCFNRLVDWNIDKENPRTENRHRLINQQSGWILMFLSIGLMVFGTLQLNLLCVVLSPLAIVMVTFYSITKRFTAYSHLFLGLALAAAPMGAWAAVKGELWSLTPYVLALAVLLWVGGFDIIYATMDVEFDRSRGLNSIPARLGIPKALKVSRALHIAAAAAFGFFGWLAGLGLFFAGAWLLTCGCLIWEQKVSSSSNPHDLNKAFFQINAAVSIVLLLGVALDIFST